MKKTLKVVSILEIVIGVLSLIVAIATLALAGIISGAAESAQEHQAVIAITVPGVLGIISGIFNLGCGCYGLKGANGDIKKLSTAVMLGWIGLIAAVVSCVFTLVGDATFDRVTSAICSSVVPVLFLIAAKKVKDEASNS